MKKLAFILCLLSTSAFANGPKFIGPSQPYKVNGSSNTAWAATYQEFLNTYNDIRYPQISTGTAQNFTIVNGTATTIGISSGVAVNYTVTNSTITNLTVTGAIKSIVGRILQLITATTTTGFSTTSSSYQTTNLSLSITLKCASSNIIIFASGTAENDNASVTKEKLTLSRNGSVLYFDALYNISTPTTTAAIRVPATLMFIDSPGAGTYTYAVKILSTDNSNTVRFGVNDGDAQYMILAEVGQC